MKKFFNEFFNEVQKNKKDLSFGQDESKRFMVVYGFQIRQGTS